MSYWAVRAADGIPTLKEELEESTRKAQQKYRNKQRGEQNVKV